MKNLNKESRKEKIAELEKQLSSKNRELEIEAALEKVRARSMAMKKSHELKEVIQLIYEQFIELEIHTEHAGIILDYKERDDMHIWLADGLGSPSELTLPYFDCPHWNGFVKAKKKGLHFFAINHTREQKDDFYRKLFQFVPEISEASKKTIFGYKGLAISTVLLENVALYIENFEGIAYADEDNETLLRFGKVFQQTYTRFLDLQKAETQAKEAQIEAALERVRSRSLAMHHSSELSAVVDTLLREFTNLEFTLTFCIINLIDEQDLSNTVWAANPETGKDPESYYMKFEDYPFHHAMWDAWKAQKKRFVYTIEGEEKKIYDEYLYSKTEFRRFPKHVQEANKSLERYVAGFTFFKYSGLQTVSEEYISEEDLDILEHFGRVFEQAYTRFLDLQKAEAQAREAKIEVALEKVRSRTMGMQRSDELAEVANVLFSEMNDLVHNLWTCGFVLCERDRKEDEWWLSLEDGFSRGFFLPNINDYAHETLYEGWREGEAFRSVQLEGDKLQAHYDWLMKIPVAKKIFDDMEAAGMQRPDWQMLHAAYFSKGYLVIITREPCREEEIFQRFAKVFDQTYTRFLDLQRAEAQGRESEIQLALERVRARTMAMQSSEELADAAFVLFEQLRNLGGNLWGTGFGLSEEHVDKDEFWFANENGVLPPVAIPNTTDQAHRQMHKGWKEKTDFLCIEKSGKALKHHYDYMLSLPEVKPFFQKIIDAGLSFPERQQWNAAYFSKGYLLIITLEPYPEPEILKRFAKVFEQTYTRFLDLQRAEAQAREAQIEAALEKVRSRSMAMHNSQELKEVALELRKQMGLLGQKDLEVCAIHLYGYGEDSFESWSAMKAHGTEADIVQTQAHFPKRGIRIVDELIHHYTIGSKDYILVNEGEKIAEWFKVMKKHAPELHASIMDSIGKVPIKQLKANWAVADFSGGALVMVIYGEPDEVSRNLLRRSANVFEQAYVRFLDLQKAEAQARESEIQLALERVRARTMAMQHSEELADASNVLDQQVRALGIETWGCAFHIYSDNDGGDYEWFSGANGLLPFYKTPREEFFLKFYEKGQKGEKFHIEEFKGGDCKVHYDFLKTIPVAGDALKALEESGVPLPDYQIDHIAFFKYGYVLFITYKPAPEAHAIFQRFAKVFEQTYTRFLDLQKAEAQAKEARLEAALEKVRGVALSLQKSNDMLEIAQVLYEQLLGLGFTNMRNALIDFHNGADETFTDYDYSHEMSGTVTLMSYNDDPTLQEQFRKMVSKTDDFFEIVLEGKKLEDLIEMRLKNGEAEDPRLRETDTLTYNMYSFGNGSIGISNFGILDTEHKEILERFRNVFTFAYKRYSELKHAEAQLRESQIEAALEKVRSRSLAMQKSDQLLAVIIELSAQLQQLNVRFDFVSFGVIGPEKEIDFWMAGEGYTQPELFHIPYLDCHVTNSLLEAQKEGLRFSESTFNNKDTREWMEVLYENNRTSKMLKESIDDILKGPGMVRSSVIMKNICVFMGNFRLKPHTEEQNALLVRFTNAFEQTHTRFLDLQRAEAQAREAQIEAALERVRAKTMAMHKSSELSEVAVELFEQISLLTTIPSRFNIAIVNEQQRVFDIWVTDVKGHNLNKLFVFDVEKSEVIAEVFHAWKDKKKYVLQHLAGKRLDNWIKYASEDVGVPFDKSALQENRYINSILFKQGFIGITTDETPSDSVLVLLERFANVFEQTYTRFLDLQKAEAQTREAQIEAALEKVRSRSLAMQNPDELIDVAQLLREEMGALGVEELETSSIYIHDDNSGETQCWFTIKDGNDLEKTVTDQMTINLADTWVGQRMLDFYSSKAVRTSILMQGEQRIEWIRYCGEKSDLFNPGGFYGDSIPERTYHLFKFSDGFIGAASPGEISNESWDLMKRATSVFSFAYTRFRDLQKAENQAREAKIELSLERIRSKVTSMQQSTDLFDIVVGMRSEFISLGHEADYFWHMRWLPDVYEMSMTSEDGHRLGMVINVPKFVHDQIPGLAAWEKGIDPLYVLALAVEDAWDYLEKMNTHGHYKKADPNAPTHEDIEHIGGLTFVIARTTHGEIGYSLRGVVPHPPKEALDTLARFAGVFDLAYKRFEDLQTAEKDLIEIKAAREKAEKALIKLKSAQDQLIQAEKLASLGQLTAGIAHEIKNPLNFVNNFSEVSMELIDEVFEELGKLEASDSAALIAEILQDVKSNLAKVYEHGSRADSIVKSMLQHSRGGSGIMEPTDLNALLKEYTNLAFHGMRAGKKPINVGINLQLDPEITKVPLMGEDFTRVVLNICNNAFDAMRETETLRTPELKVRTQKTNKYISIEIEDNGPGISEEIKDKILQPFFTTKKGTEGTGLGLSITNDIIKVHGGSLNIQSKPGQTIFQILLSI